MSEETEYEAESWQSEAGLDGDANFEKFNSVADLAKSYSEVQGMMSRSVRFPTEDASDERISEFRDRVLASDSNLMLRPEGYTEAPGEASGYEFDSIEGANVDPETEGAFKAIAHELKLNPDQANGVHKWLSENIATGQADMTESNDSGMAGLKGLWGNATEAKMEQARNTVANLSDKMPELGNMMDGLAAIGHDATGIQLMSLVAEMLGEAGATPTTHRSQLTPDEASTRLLELREKHKDLAEGDIGWQQYRKQSIDLQKAGGRISDYGSFEDYGH